MKTDNIVYRMVVARIALLGLTRREVAERLGVSYGTLHNKLCACTPFTLDEALALKTLLGVTEPIETMFRRVDEGKVM